MKRIFSNFRQKKHVFSLLFSLAILFDSNAQTDPCFTGQALPACYGCIWSTLPSITALEPCVVIEWEAFPDNPNTTADDNDINFYQIYISQKNNTGDWSTYSLLGETESLFYTASGLATNANYRLVVCVSKLSLLNVCPAGAYVSNAVDFTTPTNPVGSCEVGSCDAPYLFPQSITARSTTLRWDLKPQTTSYTIKYKASNGSSWITNSGISPSSLSIYISDLSPSTNYDSQIFSTCADGSTTSGDVIHFATINACELPAPASISAPNETVWPTSAIIKWPLVNGAQRYKLEYRPLGQLNWTAINNIEGEYYMIYNLLQRTTYETRVYALCDDKSESLPSPTITFFTGAYCTWTGGNGFWNTAAKWDCGIVPGSNDVAIINSPSTTVTLTTNINVKKIQLTKGKITGNRNVTTIYFNWVEGTIEGTGTFLVSESLEEDQAITTTSLVINQKKLIANGMRVPAENSYYDRNIYLNNGAVFYVPAGKNIAFPWPIVFRGTGTLDNHGTISVEYSMRIDGPNVINAGFINAGYIPLQIIRPNGSIPNDYTGGSFTASTIVLDGGSHKFDHTTLESVYINNNLEISGGGTVDYNCGNNPSQYFTVLLHEGCNFNFNCTGPIKGLFKGLGTYHFNDGTTTNEATFSPGFSPGTLNIASDFTNNKLNYEILEENGIVSNDLLQVTDNMNLAGELTIAQLGGTIPPGIYEIAKCDGSADCLSGQFQSVIFPPGCNGNCSLFYSNNHVSLVVGAPIVYKHPDYDALVAFYNSTNGNNWNNNGGWFDGVNCTDCDVCQWPFVFCDDSHRVSALSIQFNNLTGYLPPEIANLNHLTRLELSGNQISGIIPQALGTLPLISLDLHNNQLSGCFPSTLVSQCSNSTVNFSNNPDLPGGGDFAAFCANGAGQCEDNDGDGYSFSNDCDDTNPYIHPGASELCNGIDDDCDGQIDEGVEHPDYASLMALYNATDGANWTDNTGWGATPCDVCGWYGVGCDVNGRVVSIELIDNNLTGAIPPEIGDLEYLEQLKLINNNLSGNIQIALTTLPHLQYLYLGANQFTGPIPPELGNLSNLLGISFFQNQLTGSLPAELGNLANLTELDFQINQLTGPIPTELGNLTNLYFVALGNNQLSGNIPASFANLSNLEVLDLSINQLAGSIPVGLGGLGGLKTLLLNENQLTGPIPAALGNLSNLNYLALNNNQLSGKIPASLGNLSGLLEIFLQGNQLTGCFPSALASLCPTLYDFSNNAGLPGGGNFAAFCADGTGVCPPPVAVCKNITVQLDPSQVTVPAAALDGGSTSSTGALVFSISGSPSVWYDCSAVGSHAVTLTVTDANSNIAQCAATISVQDVTPPTITCPASVTVCANPAINQYVGTSVLNPTVTDNCSTLANVTYQFTGATTGTGAGTATGKVFNLNATTIRYTVTDAGGSSSCSLQLTVRKSPLPYWQPPTPNPPVPVGAMNLKPYIKDNRSAAKTYKIYLGAPTGTPVCTMTAVNGVVSAGQNCWVTHSTPGLYQYYAVAINDYATGLDCEFVSGAFPVTVVGPGQTSEGGVTLDSKELGHVAPVLFPNPTDGLLNVLFEENKHDSLSMMFYDTNGRLVMKSDGTRPASASNAAAGIQQFDLSQLAGGVYLFRLVAGGQQYTGRVVKID